MKESGLSLKKRQYNIGFSYFHNILWLTSYNLNIIFDVQYMIPRIRPSSVVYIFHKVDIS